MLYHQELLQELKGLIGRVMKRDASRKGKKRAGKTMLVSALPAFPGLQTLENRILLSSNTFGHSDADHTLATLNMSLGDGGVVSVLDNADDDATASIDLGDNVITFYGTQYTGANQLFVSDNGLITFGSGNTSSSNTNLATGVTQAAIAPMWDDWSTANDANDMVLSKFEDTNGDGIEDRLVIEWSDVKRGNGTGGAVTFQAIIRLNTGSNESDIFFAYLDSTTGTGFANGGGATVGIKNADGAEGGADPLLISQNTGNASLLGDNQAIRVATAALDTTAPTVEITDISPDPRNSAVSSVTFTFDGPVVGFDVADLNLTHNGGENNLLTGNETLESNDGGTTWTLSGIAGLTSGDGGYTLTLTAQGSKIIDSQLNAIAEGDSDEWEVDTVAPTAVITAVTPDPAQSGVNTITITFSKAVTGLTLDDITLRRNDGGNLIDGNVTLGTEDGGITWTLGNLLGLMGEDGEYALVIEAAASGILDAAGNELSENASEVFTVDATAPDAPTIDLISDDDSGEVNSDNETNVTLPTVNGTAEAGAAIEVFVGGVSVGTTDANESGNWSFELETELAEGNNTITAKATDAAGNESDASANLVVHIDTIAPDAPGTPSLDDGSNSGSTEDTITSDNIPTITGIAEADSFVAIFNGETLVGSDQADENGAYTIELDEALSDGVHTLRIMAIDLAGNTSELSEGLELTIDTVAPAAPLALDLDADSDSGASATDNVTNNTTPTVGGTATAGTFVQVFVDGVEDGGLIFAEDGTWTHTIENALAEGQRSITAVAFDLAANDSQASGGLTVTVDVTAPTANIVDITPDPRNKVVNSIAITFSEAVSGFDTGDLSLELDDDGNRIGQGQALTTGNNINFTLTGTAAITGGQGTFTLSLSAEGAAIVDLAGNSLQVDATDVWDTDTVAPTLTIAAVSPDPTNAAVSSITFEASEEIANFSIDDLVLTLGEDPDNLLTGAQELTTNDNIHFTLSNLTGITNVDGHYTLTFTAIGSGIEDTSGNPLEEDAVEQFEVDTTAPDAPTDLALSEGSLTGSSNTRTSDTTPTITGTAEAGSFVQVLIDSVEVGDPVQANGEGFWSFNVTSELTEGAHTITATATDDAGNTSELSGNFAITIDLTAPSAPTTPDLVGDSDSGDSATDDRTNDTTPTFEGLAEDGSLVTLYFDEVAVGSGTAIGGVYSITLSVPLEDGTYEISAIATDGAGNESEASAEAGFVIDTQNDAQAVNGPSLTNDNTPTVNGISEEDATIEIFINGVSDGTTDASNAGEWTYQLPELVDGTYAITMRSTDKAGNVSAISEPLSITIDTVAPDAPTALNLVSESDSGSSDTDNLTKTALATITGSAEAHSTVEIMVGGSTVGIAEFDDEGGTTWTFSFSNGHLTEGVNNVTAKAFDGAGNESAASSTLAITLDTTAPSAPSTPNLADASDSNIDSDNNTSDNTPTFTGTAEDGATVNIFANGELVGSGTATGGNYSINVSSLEDGTYEITATATDAAGNASVLSSGLNVTIDTTAPDAPTVDGDTNTNDTTPTVTGTAQANSSVEVFIDGVSDGTVTANGQGVWTKNLSAQVAGTYAITAKATDTAGNESAASDALNITIDLTAPDAPAALDLSAGSDSGSSSTDNETSTTLATITGTTESGSTVEVFVGGVSVGPASVEGTNWSFTFAADDLAEGDNTITAKATDEAGNESSASANLVIDLDTTSPSAPSTPDLDAGSDSNVNTDNVTSDSTPTFTGTAEDGSAVKIFANGELVGSGTATGGNYSITVSSLTDGTYTITATATDAAGNVSDVSGGLSNVVIDSTAPTAPTVTGDAFTTDTTPTVSGTANEDVLFVQVYVDGVANGAPVAVTNGEWTHDITGPLAEGDYDITVTGFDLAGNESDPSSVFDLAVDLTAPDAPAALDLSAGSDSGSSSTDNETSTTLATITGTTESGSTVEVFVGGVSVGAATVVGTNWSYTFTASELSEGNNTITAKSTDQAGNESDASADLVIDLDTTSPSAPSTPDLAAGSDTGFVDADNNTSDNTPTFTGTAEADSTVKIFSAGVLVGSGTATGGNYSITVSTLADGTSQITATATDAAGNTSTLSSGLSVTIDTTAPNAPTVTGDNNTNDTTPTVSGTAEANSRVEVFIDGVSDGIVTTNGSGAWTKNLTAQVAGTYAITAKATDPAGNESVASTTFNLTIDTVAPDAPSIDLQTASDTGTSDSDNETSTALATITGTTEAGSTVEVFVGGNSVGAATVDGTSWSYTFTANELSEGNNTVTAKSTDEAGNLSVASANLVVDLDTTSPSAPSTPDLDAGSDSDINTDDITTDTTPTFTGTAEAGSTVKIFADGVEVGSGTATGGNYSITTSALEDGLYDITATATDAAGNVSNLSAALQDVQIDTTAPSIPVFSIDTNTNDTTPSMTGTGEALTYVQVFVDGVANGDEILINAQGTWSHTIVGPLTEGTFAITVVGIDEAGNSSAASDATNVTVDLTAPDAPTLLALEATEESDTGLLEDSLTSNTSPTITGTATVGTTVQLYVEGVANGDPVTVLEDGTWSATVVGELSEGDNTITATAIDEAGNESALSAALVVTIDTIAPDAPSVPNLASASDSGSSDSDNITSDTTPTFTGTAEAGTLVTIFANGEAIGSEIATGGNYTITSTVALEDGEYDITAKATDIAGNISLASSALDVTIDTNATNAPTIDGDTNTNDTTPTVAGTAPQGAVLVQVYVDGVANGSPVAVIEGGWTHTLQGPLAEGEYEVFATAIDAAGNESADSNLLGLTVDLTAPGAPNDIELASGSTNGINDLFTNTITPTIVGDFVGDTTSVEVFVGGNSVGFATLGEGSWSFTFGEGDLAEGSNSVTAKATDEAGNESVASTAFVFTVDLTAPATPAAPDLAAGSDTGSSSSDDITNDNTPTFTGTVEANGRATLFINGEAFSGQNVDGTGVYTFTLTQLVDGNYSVTVRSMDQAGNFAAADSSGLSFTIDTTAPSAPTITGDADTSDTTPTVSGTAQAGSTVEVFVDGVSDGTVTADGEGNWTKTLSQQVEGDYVITAKATDTAGNQSAASANLAIDIDTTAPTAPSTPDLSSETDSGQSTTDNLTNSGSLTLAGTAEAGSTVTLFSSGEPLLTTTAGESGTYEFNVNVAEEDDFTVSLTVTATDAAGNVSDVSGALEVTRDTTQPTVTVTPVSPDPRESAVSSITIVFSEEVFSFTLADLTLTRNGGGNLLTGAQSLTTEDGITWTLTGLSSITNTGGTYTLTILNESVNDEAGNAVAADATEVWTRNSVIPTLTTVANLTGAIKNTAFTITYEDLAAAANEADADGGDILFKVAAVSTGTLTKNGNPVVAGTTTIGEGEELVWTPANNAVGTLNAFTIRVNDGFDDSATAVQVKVVVEKPTVTLVAIDDEGSEVGPGNMSFQVERNGSTAAALTVSYSITGTAKNGSDYTSLTGTVIIAAGQSTALITVATTNDAVFETDETVILTLKTSGNYTVDGTDNTATGTIEDNEPTVSIEATDASATEAGLTTGTFTVTLSEAADHDITVFYTVTGTTTANSDYVTLTGSVLIEAGDTSATVTVTPKQDATVENSETVIVTLKTNTAYGIDADDATATVTINDDEPTVSIEATDDDASEQGLATGTFTITLSNAVTQDTKVSFKITGTAKNGTDYNTITGFVIITAGNTSATVTITPKQDTTAEADETVTLTLSTSSNYRVDDEDNAATVTIEDNEPTISIEATDDEANEQGLTTGTFTVTRDGLDNSAVLRVFYTITGTAKATTDYVKLTGFVDIAAGEETATITVTPAQDAIFEPGETVIVTLTSKTNYKLDNANKTATVTIIDNEPVISIVATDDTATEAGLTTGAFTITRTGSTAAALTVFFGVTGTAKSNTDYNSLFSSIVIPAGESSILLTVTPKADATTESAETIIVTLKTNSAYGLDDNLKSATVVLLDNVG